MAAEIDGARDMRQAFLPHQGCQAPGHGAFVFLAEGTIQHLGDDEAEHAVAEEFQTLIVLAALLPRAGRPVRRVSALGWVTRYATNPGR